MNEVPSTPQQLDQPKQIAKSALSFLSGTMVSRITGLIRDMSMACFFGASASIAAFFVALRLAILLRRILGEGALLNGFVPFFESHRKEDPKKAALFFRDVFFSVATVAVVFVAVAELVFYYWLGSPDTSLENKQIYSLIMLILPGIPFICLFGICSGLLHCEKYFFLTGVAPVCYNLIWIAAVWIFRNELPAAAAVGLSSAISLAFFFQWLITFPKTLAFLRKYLSWKELSAGRLFSPEIRAMLTSLSMGVVGVAAAQINTAFDTVFSRYACLEGPAYLNYAIHLQQLPLALFGIGIASALLPPLSRAFAADDIKQSTSLLGFAISGALLVILPCTVAIFSIGAASVNLIYGHGDFSSVAAAQTTYCLWGYGLGLIPMVLTLLLAPAFYAKKDYRTPTWTSLISIAVNLLLNALLIGILQWGPASLAFSTSFSAFLNTYLLYRSLARKTNISFPRPFFIAIAKTMVCAGLAGLLTSWIGFNYLEDPTVGLFLGKEAIFVRGFAPQWLQFSCLFVIFSLSFLGLALLLKKEEIFNLLGKLHLPKLLK